MGITARERWVFHRRDVSILRVKASMQQLRVCVFYLIFFELNLCGCFFRGSCPETTSVTYDVTAQNGHSSESERTLHHMHNLLVLNTMHAEYKQLIAHFLISNCTFPVSRRANCCSLTSALVSSSIKNIVNGNKWINDPALTFFRSAKAGFLCLPAEFSRWGRGFVWIHVCTL